MVIARKSQASPNLLRVAEHLSLVGSVAGSVASMLTQQAGYTFAPLSFSLVLALVNRQRLEPLAQQNNIPIVTQADPGLWREVTSLREQIQALPLQI